MNRLFAVMAAGFGLMVTASVSVRGQDAADTPGESSTNGAPAAPLPTNDGVTPPANDTAQAPSDTSTSPTPRDLSAAIAAKQAEIDRLKKQLQQANGQIQQLNSQNQALKTSDTTLKTEIQNAPPAAMARPQPAPLTATPGASTPVDSHDLFWYYHNNPTQADQYMTGKKMSVSGKIVGFDAPILSRVFGIELESGDPNLKVVCRFVIPRIYSAVFFHRKTGTIVGRTAAGGEDPLLNIGDQVTIEGQCKGADSGDVALNSCRLVL